jgi:YVTN family beta-propeller protein
MVHLNGSGVAARTGKCCQTGGATQQHPDEAVHTVAVAGAFKVKKQKCLSSPILKCGRPPPSGSTTKCFNIEYSLIFFTDTIINTGSNTVTGEIVHDCFSSPEAIATNPVQARAYVINRGDGTVCVVDTATRTVLTPTPIDVGGEPRYAVVAPSGAYVCVSSQYNGSDDVVKINTANNATTGIVTGGTPRNMDISPSGDKVYVALQTSDIAVIDTANDSVSTISFTGASSTYGVALMPGTNKGYVSDENDGVYVFNVTTETEITGPGYPITGEAFDYPRAIAASSVVVTTDATDALAIPSLSVWALVLLMVLFVTSGLLFKRRFF